MLKFNRIKNLLTFVWYFKQSKLNEEAISNVKIKLNYIFKKFKIDIFVLGHINLNLITKKYKILNIFFNFEWSIIMSLTLIEEELMLWIWLRGISLMNQIIFNQF